MKGVNLVMKATLPKFDYVFEDGSAELKDGILYIYRAGSFDDIMYKLAYLLWDDKTCFFCHRKFVEANAKGIIAASGNNVLLITQSTLDHLVPQTFGGPTITNNLRPTCRLCNSTKSNFYPDEYRRFIEISKLEGTQGWKERRIFKQEIKEIQLKRLKGEVRPFPEEWYSPKPKSVFVNISQCQALGEGYRKQESFLKKYGRLQKPIILSNNGVLLSGFNSLLLSKYYNVKHIDYIILENVVYAGVPCISTY